MNKSSFNGWKQTFIKDQLFNKEDISDEHLGIMGKKVRSKNRHVEKSIRNLLQEKMVQQRQEKVMKRLDHSEKSCLKTIDNEALLMKERLASYGRGMTSLTSYYNKEVSDLHKNTIWFPLQRTATDWKPQPCWIGKAAVDEARCPHFPCRNITSYHFIFRDLPQWLLQEADASVRRSKDNINLDLNKNGIKQSSTEDPSPKHKDPINRKPWTKGNNTAYVKLPPVNISHGMTAKERKLKLIIERKRVQNELDNKPLDRNVNYGKPTSVRRLQQPVRPVVRRMDIR